MPEPTHAYVARCKCGGLRACEVDEAGREKETARAVAGWIERGRTVDRITIEETENARWCKTGK